MSSGPISQCTELVLKTIGLRLTCEYGNAKVQNLVKIALIKRIK